MSVHPPYRGGALQAALYARLSSDPAVAALAPGLVFDAAPPEAPAGPYLVLGEEEMRARADADGGLAEHLLQITAISDAAGFAGAKALAEAAVAAALSAPLVPAGAGPVALEFLSARARRVPPRDARHVELRLRAVLDRADPTG